MLLASRTRHSVSGFHVSLLERPQRLAVYLVQKRTKYRKTVGFVWQSGSGTVTGIKCCVFVWLFVLNLILLVAALAYTAVIYRTLILVVTVVVCVVFVAAVVVHCQFCYRSRD